MHDKQPLVIRGSSFSFRLHALFGSVPALSAIALSFWSFSEAVYLLGFLGLVFLIAAVRVGTQRVTVIDGQLRAENFFVKQRVDLGSLVKARQQKLLMVAQPARLVLKLKDSQGNKVTIEPGLFDEHDNMVLAEALRPYVFRPSVDKNFIMFWFGGEPLVLPKTKPKQVVKGTLLYVLLPCALLTAAVVIWAIATNQPAFR